MLAQPLQITKHDLIEPIFFVCFYRGMDRKRHNVWEIATADLKLETRTVKKDFYKVSLQAVKSANLFFSLLLNAIKYAFFLFN